MFRLIVLVVAIASCTAYPRTLNPRLRGIDGRIVGGNETTIEEHPWQVSLRYHGIHYCGGSLILNNTVITAAHCAVDIIIGSDKVVVGTSSLSEGGDEFNVASYLVHENYDPSIIDRSNDIAILKLDGVVMFSDSVNIVNLAEQDKEAADGAEVTVSGWGTEHESDWHLPETLRKVNVNIVNRETCQKQYGDIPVTETMICTGVNGGGKASCQGDSGGPVTIDNVLYGIVSWGYGCGRPNYPGVYSNVAKLRSWIKENSGV